MPKEKTKREETTVTLKTTGENLDNKDDARKALKDLSDEKKRLEQEYQEKLSALQYDQEMIKEVFQEKKPKVTKVDSNFFYKLKKDDENNHNILNLSHSARELFFLLILHMDYMDNVVTIDRKYPSNEELQKLFKMSRVTFQKSLKELKEMDMICLSRKTKYRIITVNPYYAEDTKTTENVKKLFKQRNF